MRNELKTLILAAAVAGCGDDGGREDSASATSGVTGPGISGTLPTGDTAPTTGEGTDGGGSSSGGNSGGNSNSDSQGSGDTTNDSSVTVTAGDDDGMTKTDLGALPDFGVGCGVGGMGGNEPDFSYIWVANSQQNTISKIDTQTLVEKGRYWVRPDNNGSPSRTSVNLSGDVVTASRSGGFTKFYARLEDCKESNGIPGIQTSVDANMLPWDQEECRAWHTPMGYASQRPAAWTQGTFNNASCIYENQKVWTSGNNNGNGTVDVLLVNGDTGAIESNVQVSGIKGDFYGIYGAAVDKDGNFWGSQLSSGYIVNINRETLQYKTWPMAASGYGMTVDSKGYVWTCSSTVARFDPMTETWQTNSVGGSGGCMEDGKGTLYMSGGGNSIIAVDTETLQVKTTYPVPQYVHGISIDFYGYVWGVSMGSEAYRLDITQNGAFQTFNTLVGAYTYSDMTGFALSNVGQPSG
jgi:hypothetical protein